MSDYLDKLEPFRYVKEMSNIIDDVKKLRAYYNSHSFTEMEKHISKIYFSYINEAVIWNKIFTCPPQTYEQAYQSAEEFLRTKAFAVLLEIGIKLQ